MFTTRTSNKNTSSSGNSNATPNAMNISMTSVRYLSAAMKALERVAAHAEQELERLADR